MTKGFFPAKKKKQRENSEEENFKSNDERIKKSNEVLLPLRKKSTEN